jgi:hypothetical protein
MSAIVRGRQRTIRVSYGRMQFDSRHGIHVLRQRVAAIPSVHDPSAPHHPVRDAGQKPGCVAARNRNTALELLPDALLAPVDNQVDLGPRIGPKSQILDKSWTPNV